MNPNTLRIAAALVAVLTLIGTANAALICGAVQMRHFGIHDQSFRLARHWAAALPHTTAHPGAVVVQSRAGRDSAGHPGGHVSRIVENRGQCRALVADSRGTYERDICSRLIAYVDPNGKGVTAERKERNTHYAMSAKRHRHREQSVKIGFVPIDRLMMH